MWPIRSIHEDDKEEKTTKKKNLKAVKNKARPKRYFKR